MFNPNTFIASLKGYDKSTINAEMFAKLRKYTGDPKFNPDHMRKSGKVVFAICQWVLDIEKYAQEKLGYQKKV